MGASHGPVLGVSGVGSIGTQHLRAAGELGVDVVVCDPTPDLRERALRAGALAAYATFEELLARGPDGVVVAGPDHVHVPQLVAANAAGIPVLVEKPVAPTFQEARGLGSVVDPAAPVLVGYVLHHHPAMQEAARAIRDGTIGEPVGAQAMLGAYRTLEVARSRFAVPEHGRLFRDYSHEWDYLRWFFGPVREVTALARDVPGPALVERPNVVDGMVRFDSGLTAAFHLDYVDPVGVRRLQVSGTRGWLSVDAGTGLVAYASLGRPPATYDLAFRGGGALRLQLEHFLEVVAGRAEPAVALADGIAALAVTEAALRAAGAGGWVAVRD